MTRFRSRSTTDEAQTEGIDTDRILMEILLEKSAGAA